MCCPSAGRCRAGWVPAPVTLSRYVTSGLLALRGKSAGSGGGPSVTGPTRFLSTCRHPAAGRPGRCAAAPVRESSVAAMAIDLSWATI